MEAMAGLALSVAQSLFAALHCSELKQIFSIFGYESELERIQSTVDSIIAMMQDGESNAELSNQEQVLVGKLKDAVYYTDDLLDWFKTLLAEHQELQTVEKRSDLCDKVRLLISGFGKLHEAYDMTRMVIKIRGKSEGISSDSYKFLLDADNRPLKNRREEKCSYVYQEDAIGREDDEERVIDMLLDENDGSMLGNVSVLSIVGMGGIGKTTLAQLVFNDKLRIEKEFPLRLWASLADEGQEQLDVRAILAKIDGKDDGSSLERIYPRVQRKLQGMKYLLVLDDVWTENRGEWMKLEEFLKGGLSGSRILITTRSEGTATAAGNRNFYKLNGLSEEKAWDLFNLVAFAQKQEDANPPELVRIGRNIVERCSGVPLAIKVAGSLLYCQDRSTWVKFQKKGSDGLGKEEAIMRTLRFSFDNLESSLKSCFSYCALFPKAFIIEKDKLIFLWMAQGYLGSSDGDNSLFDVGEEYFSTLLRRCFFQDVKRSKDGQVVSCKIHDLMHNIAQLVAGDEVCVANSRTKTLHKYVRHVYHCTEVYLGDANIRTYFQHGNYGCGVVFCDNIFASSLNCLRALDLSDSGVEHLPDNLGDLLHLRYLDLSGNFGLEILPLSITKLVNLQTLRLDGTNATTLPTDFIKLIKLEVLLVSSNYPRTYIPFGARTFTRLERLNIFAVGKGAGKLEDLRALRKLKGNITIHIGEEYTYCEDEGVTGGYICDKEGLTEIKVYFGIRKNQIKDDEALLEHLKPHRNLRGLVLELYAGVKLPKWAGEGNLAAALPNLVKLNLTYCSELQLFPGSGKLPCLKWLRLEHLYIEFMESTNKDAYAAAATISGNSSAGDPVAPVFFPSLEELELCDLPNLQGWWKGMCSRVGDGNCMKSHNWFPSFPRLLKLDIFNCPELKTFPGCPVLEELVLRNCDEQLRVIIAGDEKEVGVHSSPTLALKPSSSAHLQKLECGNTSHPVLRVVEVDKVASIKSQPSLHVFHLLSKIVICFDYKIENLSEVGEVFRSCSSSLRFLKILDCENLKSLFGGGLENLTALETLVLQRLPELTFDEEEDGGTGMSSPWQSLAHCLHKLELHGLPKLKKIPEGMRHLTSLQSLKITYCPAALEDPPNWIRSRESLHFEVSGHRPGRVAGLKPKFPVIAAPELPRPAKSDPV